MLRTTFLLVIVGFTTVSTSYAQDRSLKNAEKKIIARAYGERLKDPVSAQYRWHNLIKSTSSRPDEMVYCFQVNAKNSYGGYVGFQTVFGTVTQRNGIICRIQLQNGCGEQPHYE